MPLNEQDCYAPTWTECGVAIWRCRPELISMAVRCMFRAKIRGKTENSMKNTAMKIPFLFFLIAAAFAAMPACAQLAPPNSAGVTMGHIHLFVKDVDVQKKFWTETM